MTVIQAIILSIVEGVTEFLPISSTGHLILAANVLKIPETEFVKSFQIIVQLGAILAVTVLYWNMLMKNRFVWQKIIIAFIPAAFVGFSLYKIIKQYLLGNTMVVLWSLLLGGIVLVFLDKFLKPKQRTILGLSMQQCIIIGLFQTLSLIPGVSRAAATIVGGLVIGLNRKEAVEFSFLLAIPTMAAACGLDLLKTSAHFSPSEYQLLLTGFIGAFITAIFAIRAFITFIQRHSFRLFGVYRILLALLFFYFFR